MSVFLDLKECFTCLPMKRLKNYDDWIWYELQSPPIYERQKWISQFSTSDSELQNYLEKEFNFPLRVNCRIKDCTTLGIAKGLCDYYFVNMPKPTIMHELFYATEDGHFDANYSDEDDDNPRFECVKCLNMDF